MPKDYTKKDKGMLHYTYCIPCKKILWLGLHDYLIQDLLRPDEWCDKHEAHFLNNKNTIIDIYIPCVIGSYNSIKRKWRS